MQYKHTIIGPNPFYSRITVLPLRWLGVDSATGMANAFISVAKEKHSRYVCIVHELRCCQSLGRLVLVDLHNNRFGVLEEDFGEELLPDVLSVIQNYVSGEDSSSGEGSLKRHKGPY